MTLLYGIHKGDNRLKAQVHGTGEPHLPVIKVMSNFEKMESGTDSRRFVLHIFRSFISKEVRAAIFLCPVEINKNVEDSGAHGSYFLPFASTLPMLPPFGYNPTDFH